MEENELNLKPFDLEAAKAGKSVCTRDGRKARIICFDAKNIGSDRPIIGLVHSQEGQEFMVRYDSNGKYDSDTNLNLMMLPENHEGWINVYKERIYDTKEEAIAHKAPGTKYIDTIKVKWQE